MNKTIILDALFGALLLGSFSYFTSLYQKDNNYIKIVAYLWAIPGILFYLLRVASRRGKDAMLDFITHALLGLFLSLVALICTFILKDLNSKLLIIYNLLYLITCIFLYFHFKIYNKFFYWNNRFR